MEYRSKIVAVIVLLGLLSLACGPSFLARSLPTPTATPTKTPSPLPTNTPDPALATDTPTPLPSPTDTPVPPTDTPIPAEPTPTEQPTATPEPERPTPTEEPTAAPAPEELAPTEEPAEAEVEPASPPTEEPTPETDMAYKIVHYKVLGEGENNGGIFNKGGQHLIFLTVLDENGNGIDGAIVKDANGSALEVVTGDKGPGKAEITMEWEPYKLYVAADPNGPTTSQVSNQMNTAYPHIPDIVGKLGDINNEYSVCPTSEVRCEPPFYSVHFSYEITFQRQP